MSDYRRCHVAGGTYFFTVVTADRKPWLGTEVGCNAFRNAYKVVAADAPFKTMAAVVLPDHMHCIWMLPDNEHEFSRRWQRIKRRTTELLKRHGMEGPFWQPRFWEHLIRDESDLCRHMDYVHYNPVKHGLVPRASQWGPSSIHRYIRMGWYAPDWAIPDVEALEAEIPGVEADR